MRGHTQTRRRRRCKPASTASTEARLGSRAGYTSIDPSAGRAGLGSRARNTCLGCRAGRSSLKGKDPQVPISRGHHKPCARSCLAAVRGPAQGYAGQAVDGILRRRAALQAVRGAAAPDAGAAIRAPDCKLQPLCTQPHAVGDLTELPKGALSQVAPQTVASLLTSTCYVVEVTLEGPLWSAYCKTGNPCVCSPGS